MPKEAAKSSRPVTGRMVLICLIAFFGVVGGVNAVMIRAATSTFGGIETENAYKAGLNFGRDIAAAHAQDRLHWHVDGKVDRNVQGVATATLTVNDERNRPVEGIQVRGRLSHPTNRKLDHILAMERIGPGRYVGAVDASQGQWDFIVEIDHEAQRTFQSRTRVYLK